MGEIVSAAGIPVVLALLAIVWPEIQSRHRRRAFQRLILRELEEVGPKQSGAEIDRPGGWWELQTKTFVHQRILADTTVNRDFILSLDPTLTYLVSQLWLAQEAKDSAQWLWYLRVVKAV